MHGAVKCQPAPSWWNQYWRLVAKAFIEVHTVLFKTWSEYIPQSWRIPWTTRRKYLPIHYYHTGNHFVSTSPLALNNFTTVFSLSICLTACLVTVVKHIIFRRTIWPSGTDLLWMSVNKKKQYVWTLCWPNWALALCAACRPSILVIYAKFSKWHHNFIVVHLQYAWYVLQVDHHSLPLALAL